MDFRCLRCLDRIIAKVESQYWKQTHKLGIEVPKSLEDALEIDRLTGTNLWRKAIEKEMSNVMPAFKVLKDDEPTPIGHHFIGCHMIFDVKMDFTRKARYCPPQMHGDNAYLNAQCCKKVWTTAGPELGSNKGKRVIRVRVLYGLKSSSGAAWRAHLAKRCLTWSLYRAKPTQMSG